MFGTGSDVDHQVDFPNDGHCLTACVSDVRLVFELVDFFPHILRDLFGRMKLELAPVSSTTTKRFVDRTVRPRLA